MGCGCNKGLAEGQTRNAPQTLVKAGWVIEGAGWKRKGSDGTVMSMSAAMLELGYTFDPELKLWARSV